MRESSARAAKFGNHGLRRGDVLFLSQGCRRKLRQRHHAATTADVATTRVGVAARAAWSMRVTTPAVRWTT